MNKKLEFSYSTQLESIKRQMCVVKQCFKYHRNTLFLYSTLFFLLFTPFVLFYQKYTTITEMSKKIEHLEWKIKKKNKIIQMPLKNTQIPNDHILTFLEQLNLLKARYNAIKLIANHNTLNALVPLQQTLSQLESFPKKLTFFKEMNGTKSCPVKTVYKSNTVLTDLQDFRKMLNIIKESIPLKHTVNEKILTSLSAKNTDVNHQLYATDFSFTESS